jgi:hypothetical protein
MGRQGQWIKQPFAETDDISNWKEGDGFAIYLRRVES